MDEVVNQRNDDASSEAKALRDILVWSSDCPNWQRDALRRLYSKDSLNSDDLVELRKICKGEAVGLPLTNDHIRDPETLDIEVTLTKIHNLKHVNALQMGQVLTFQKSGLTVIYGDNGAGKSGYARVLKHACRARFPKGDIILPNINDSEIGTPQANIEFCVGGQNRSLAWQQGGPADSTLTAISVFDNWTANVHVNDNNELAYTPTPLKIMTALADACRSLKSTLETEIKTLQNQTPAVLKDLKCGSETAVGKLLKNLSADITLEQVEDHAGLSKDQNVRLRQIKTDLASDPIQVEQRLQKLKSKVEKVIQRLSGIANAVTEEQVEVLRARKHRYDKARTAAKLASANLFSAEPLPEVGSDIWRNLWEAARKFSEGAAYPERSFPVTDDARCVLCQQKLTPKASARLNLFEAFVREETKKREDDALQAYQEAKAEIVDQILPLHELREFVSVIRDNLDDTELAATVRRVGLMATWRRRAILRVLETENNFELPPVASVPISELNAHVNDLSKRVVALLAKKDAPERKYMIDERDELEARQWLEGIKEDVLAQINRFAEIDDLIKAQKATATNRITTLSTNLAKTLVTNRLRARFAQEVNKLGVAGLAIELQQIRSAAGIPFFRVQLISKPDAPVGKVLSEGEHRCVALAAFLAELATVDTSSAIVFDDPVCSLDHIHRDKVAERLANESLKRQVVIFTHDVAFLVLLQEACRKTLERPAIPLSYRVVSRGAEAAGFCNSEPPANVLPVEEVVQQMRQHLDNVKIHHTCGNQANWRREVGSFEKELREAWERAVEGVVSPVIKRLSQKVQTTGLVKLTVLREEDCTTMREAYSRCSNLLHSQPGEINPQLPAPDDIKCEIAALETWITEIRDRQKAV